MWTGFRSESPTPGYPNKTPIQSGVKSCRSQHEATGIYGQGETSTLVVAIRAIHRCFFNAIQHNPEQIPVLQL
jgi:hypothetical protein